VEHRSITCVIRLTRHLFPPSLSRENHRTLSFDRRTTVTSYRYGERENEDKERERERERKIVSTISESRKSGANVPFECTHGAYKRDSSFNSSPSASSFPPFPAHRFRSDTNLAYIFIYIYRRMFFLSHFICAHAYKKDVGMYIYIYILGETLENHPSFPRAFPPPLPRPFARAPAIYQINRYSEGGVTPM